MFNKKIHILGETITITPLWILILFAIILRIPSLFEPYWYGDEAIYLTLGEGIRHNLVLYRDIFDHKPPLIYLIAAAAGSLYWFKLILLVWSIGTIALFWKLARETVKNSTILEKNHDISVVVASTIFTISTTLPMLEGNIANAELFLIGPIFLGLLFTLSEWPNFVKNKLLRIFIGGVLFSFALLFKVPAIFDVFALVAFWGISSLWKPKDIIAALKKSIVLTLGLFLPIFISVFYFWSQGALKQYITAGLSQNITYIGQWANQKTVLSTGQNALSGLGFRAEVLIVLLLVVLFTKKFFDKYLLFVILWLTFDIFAMLLSGRPYPHYIIQAIPPLSLAGVILFFGKEKFRFLPVPFIGLFLASLVFYKFYYYPTIPYYQNFVSFITGQKSKQDYYKHFDQKVQTTYDLAQYLVLRTSKDDRIFIWGTEPEVYALSHRVPASRYITSFHISDFKGEEETLNSLQDKKVKYIILDTREERNLPGLTGLLERNYYRTDEIANNQIWKLKNF
ncbi:MAG: hypothetical protein A3D24_02620 [Candidatus Blackburnbacteria bacterium RIFCSPHIGHO2_02_FULL_39_13]|uniref:Glycosyltransferase RgtA/B/C/D-like domain-containing protein n=1 Tax=Candidatus Blackburnbacteria bacterium RIFCSPLOWO2_01_FULL_40_20 TaxID=1797519 RepID=A0A1G1VEY5_9BACT|nr:MAG: hypothetical protein UT38_C0008G0006 [Microgenomates group bacterium GW2011_GWA2_39_19]OGY09272.1 MAG: hypothetical protein A3D24_02620 [Candidatus Blackburnbacteria bacterium RIFCSPHIGHO2_02_FULL_39_13]OGY13897.1 MAG: hypothetical protein A3A77_01210 [Candidatus Blackburnbacteria bacterium RIFCSPLOWO2_01_FULL_40_20]OGY14935.1 MAG: hypothetical protein A3I52_02680 [Candidatus Blackburnbacteria bacterium RIFCSPLOWO2_02_FULL_40_10]HBL51700.1 hypothetical protein [Candidatus Blackburnbacte